MVMTKCWSVSRKTIDASGGPDRGHKWLLLKPSWDVIGCDTKFCEVGPCYPACA